jgi:hypothetical protein
MVVANSNSLCKEAELHYYDFILGRWRELIPQHIVEHISQCRNCQEQLNQLKVALLQADSIDPEQSHANSAITAMLKLHFAYIGRPVTCQTVKPFLPTLLDPVLAIRIPTPITAHIDNCRRCSEDLETIRMLNLNRNQLSRMSQLFAESPPQDKVSCSKAQSAVLFVMLMTLREVDADVLKHLCTCRDCRKALYEYRETVCKELYNGTEPKEFPCEEVSAVDIFDYVIPYGLDPAKNQYARFRESLCSHVRRCPTCLAKMQRLHETVYSILDSEESGIVTICNVDESAKLHAAGKSDNLYSDFPVKVEVLNRKDKAKAKESASTINFTAALKRKLSSMNLKPLAKVGVAAAAAILVAAALLLNTPTAKGVTIEQIYKAIDKIKNVYVASFVPGRKEAVQEKWVSHALNVYMTKTGGQLVLWDFQNKVKKTRHLDSNLVETTELSAAKMITEIGMKVTTFLGLVPFANLSVIPADASWSQVTDQGLAGITEGVEVYDLTWSEKAYDGSIVFKKWRVFVDPTTNLPQRTKFYERLSGDSEYKLQSLKVVKYLGDTEIQAVIKNAAF